MKRILLVFDDPREMEFIEANLIESGFEIFKCFGLKDVMGIAKKIIPDLIVINTLDTEPDLQLFNKNLKTEQQLENVIILSLTELRDYLNTSGKEHFVVKPIRPKLLLSLIRGVMNNEEVNWLPTLTHLC